MSRVHDTGEIALEERHARTLHGHIGAGTHRNTDVCDCQRGGVVETVSSHGNNPTLRAQAFDHLALVLRENFRLDVCDAESLRHGLGCSVMNPGGIGVTWCSGLFISWPESTRTGS